MKGIDMAASIKDVMDFFRTGRVERDSMKAFQEEWKKLSEAEKTYFRENVPSAS